MTDIFAAPDIDMESLIHEFERLDGELRDGYARKREIASDLASVAFEQRGTQNTARLVSHDGVTVKVEFKQETAYDAEQMRTVAELLGEGFDDLFKTEIKFVPQRRNLTKFLNTVSTDERIQTAKELIQQAASTKDLSPYLSVERKSK